MSITVYLNRNSEDGAIRATVFGHDGQPVEFFRLSEDHSAQEWDDATTARYLIGRLVDEGRLPQEELECLAKVEMIGPSTASIRTDGGASGSLMAGDRREGSPQGS